MFGFARKKKNDVIYSPVNGQIIPLAEVPDQMFATKMLGDGVGLIMSEGVIYAPCDGKIAMIAETRHAIGLVTAQGLELLIHIGLDTVALKGEGFTLLTSVGANVKQGAPLIAVDLVALERKGINLVTPLIVTNGADFPFEIVKAPGAVSTADVILQLS